MSSTNSSGLRPGFGGASPARELPHEESADELREQPGPGAYETNQSEISKANGHASAFKPPTERKKLRNVGVARGTLPGSRRRGSQRKGVAAAADMVHV